MPDRARVRSFLAALAAVSALFLYGVGVGKWRWPPHDTLLALFRLVPGERKREREFLEATAAARRERLADRIRAQDPRSAITLRTAEDVATRRRTLAERIWGPGGLPMAARPAKVEADVEHPAFPKKGAVRRIDRVVVEMDHGIRSVAYLFNPARGARFVVFHEGHAGDIRWSRDAILGLLESGRSVLAFAMPLLGENAGPRITHPTLGVIDLETHDQLGHLERPLRYFLEPVVAGISHLAETWGAQDVDMVGISGGGWTTTVVAALDVRVRGSYPVAGSLPLSMRPPGEWGDFEQHAPDLVDVAGYLDLYVMGAAGKGRRQLQVLHRHDPVAFAGDAANGYAMAVSEVVNGLGGGTWALDLDDEGAEHAVTRRDLGRILAHMDGP
jgi:hypothetical protein